MNWPTTMAPAEGGRNWRIHRLTLVANVAVIALSVVLFRLVAIRVFAWDMPDLLSLGGIITAGTVTFLTSILPKVTRARILAKTRTALQSKKGTLACLSVLLLAVAMCGLSRQQISWYGPPNLTVEVGGNFRSLSSIYEHPEGLRQAAIIRYAFIPFTISTKNYELVVRPRPLKKNRIDLPLFATRGSDETIIAAEDLILRAFYQFFEQRQLESANSYIDGLRRNDKQLDRVRAIEKVASETLTGSTPLLTPLTVSQFNSRYPNDPWQPLSEAALSYSKKEFDACVSALSDSVIANSYAIGETNIAVTEEFFRAACYMKQATISDAKAKPELLQQARLGFALTEKKFGELKTSSLSSIALPSAIVFQGISYFYVGKFDEAVATFGRTFKRGEVEIRARAYNGAGFARFVQGRIDESAELFNSALTISPSFPYAISNSGYVLLAKGDLREARIFFERNAKDLNLQKTSQRDVILANLSLVHVDELEGKSLIQLNDSYAALSAQIGGNQWDSITDDNVRYGYLARELTERIYMSGKYYGLEMFAMNFLCRAKARLSGSSKNPALQADLTSRISAIRGLVHPSWLNSNEVGWFASLRTC